MIADAMAQLELGLASAGLPVDIAVCDTFSAFDAVLNNPGAFGFTNSTEACLDNLDALLAGCPGYLFFDFTHPTAVTHRILAQGLLVAVPSLPAGALVLLGAGLAALAGRRGRRMES